MSDPTASRPDIVGADSGPASPYPYRMAGTIISGFGRGSKELGIPTANIPVDASQTPWISDIPSGIYFGWAALVLPPLHSDNVHKNIANDNAPTLYPMVMSIGYNPFFNNATRSAEVHLLHEFSADFYGAPMRLLLLDFIRPERGDYANLDALVSDIKFDCVVARNSLARRGWRPSRTGAGTEAGGREVVVVGLDAESEDGELDVQWLLDVGKDEETK